MAGAGGTLLISFLFLIAAAASSSPAASAVNTTASSNSTASASDTCNGIFISYAYTGGEILPPHRTSDPAHQPYRFESTLTILNNGADELQAWRVFVGFQHDEILVSASNALLADGTTLPAGVGNGTVFAGFPQSDLLTGIETAGDLSQMEVVVDLVGTQFGVKGVPMPSNVSLDNEGFICPSPTMRGNAMLCCA